jgi:RNA-directed DNA polymerase
VLSPLFSDLYLHPLDAQITAMGYQMIRYSDDFIILSESREEVQGALEAVTRWMEGNGLKLHEEKTRIGNCAEEGQGFELKS